MENLRKGDRKWGLGQFFAGKVQRKWAIKTLTDNPLGLRRGADHFHSAQQTASFGSTRHTIIHRADRTTRPWLLLPSPLPSLSQSYFEKENQHIFSPYLTSFAKRFSSTFLNIPTSVSHTETRHSDGWEQFVYDENGTLNRRNQWSSVRSAYWVARTVRNVDARICCKKVNRGDFAIGPEL